MQKRRKVGFYTWKKVGDVWKMKSDMVDRDTQRSGLDQKVLSNDDLSASGFSAGSDKH